MTLPVRHSSCPACGAKTRRPSNSTHCEAKREAPQGVTSLVPVGLPLSLFSAPPGRCGGHPRS
ncbi:MAG: hypothetical protein QOG18_2735 [Microbacteriaceae bacterium]|nr:hypothetical protein [Microbacteriaceae bacterium]